MESLVIVGYGGHQVTFRHSEGQAIRGTWHALLSQGCPLAKTKLKLYSAPYPLGPELRYAIPEGEAQLNKVFLGLRLTD